MSGVLTLTSAEEALAASLPDGELLKDFHQRGLPNRRVEAWKWSDLRHALRDVREPSGPYEYTPEAPTRLLPEVAGPELVLANGLLRSPTDIPPAVRISRRDASPLLWEGAEVASLATAAPATDIQIEHTLDHPLFIRRLSSGAGQHADCVTIDVEEGVEATIIETHCVHGSPFTNSLTLINLAPGAKLTRIIVQPRAAEAVIVHSAHILLYGDASLDQTSVCMGAHFARHETQVTHSGSKEAKIDSLYGLDGEAHNDFTTRVWHSSPNAQTRQLAKGVVNGSGKGVFQGKFLVEKEAQKTDAQMAHHALLLSDGATVNAKPELEIYADDVECAHGNTAGALDDDALFYLRQRGLSEHQARGLLIEAFGGEVLERVGRDDIRDALGKVFSGEAA